MNHTRTPSYTLPTPTLPNFQMESPTYSQFSCDTSDTGSSPGSWMDHQANEDHLPLQVKDSKLQAYFFRMEKTLRVCLPAAVHAEAMNLTREIVAKPTDVACSIRAVAETLARAGRRKVEYSRSCALIASEIFRELRAISFDAGVSFRSCLVDAVMEAFDGYYLGVTTSAFLFTFLQANRRLG